MKEHKNKNGIFDQDYMLYTHMKENVSNNTTYFVCAEEYIVRENEKVLSTSTEIIIGVIVIEKNALRKTKVNCIIHYMCILPSCRLKGYEIYLMGKVISSDPGLYNVRVYIVIRLIQYCNPSDYDEPGGKFTEK